MRLGIICPSEIAFRRFMPALQQFSNVKFIGIGVCSGRERFGDSYINNEKTEQILAQEREKAKKFVDLYGGKIFDSYSEIVHSKDIDAIYIPLPPALHFNWAMEALRAGKHVLVEKPATISENDTKKLIALAKEKKLALHENYMFSYHEQLNAIDNIVKSGELGAVRLYRISFGFPQREINDFRYNKSLGGGALIDAGGYTLKYALRLLGSTAHIMQAQMNYVDGFEVDMYGSAVVANHDGQIVQVAFGMDNNYKCDLEIWGSKGCLTTGRVLTAPAGFIPEAIIRKGNIDEKCELPSDDSFKKSIKHFLDCIENNEVRNTTYHEILSQAHIVEEFREACK